MCVGVRLGSGVCGLAGLWLAGAGQSTAFATWSILIADTRTGEVAVASATCLTGFDLRDNTPVLLTGIGAATAQSFVDSSGQNRVFVRDRLAEGIAPATIIDLLAPFDSGHQTRQYGIVSLAGGGQAATFSGTGAGGWAGGVTGRVGDLVYAVQGNVLTGAPVVAAAVDAIINTSGDVPAKLMASMQAARMMGGDGRCSCAAFSPEACGAPPPSFTKSAHIAYMLIAREGDRDGTLGLYRSARTPSSIVVADLTSDGLADVLVGDSASAQAAVSVNTTPQANLLGPNTFATFSIQPALVNAAANARLVAAGALLGDDALDPVVLSPQASQVTIRPTLGGGEFGTPVTLATLAGPTGLTLADVDGNDRVDVIVSHSSAPLVRVFLNASDAIFTPVDSSLIGPATAIAPGEFTGDGTSDFGVTSVSPNNQFLALAGSASGVLTVVGIVPLPGLSNVIAAADFDTDGRTDFAIASPSTLTIVRPQAGGTFETQTLPLTFTPTALHASDLNNDGVPELLAGGGVRLTVYRSTPTGLVSDRTYNFTTPLAFSLSISGIASGDLDQDGDTDIALASTNGSGVAIVNNLGRSGSTPPANLVGTLGGGVGQATGDYFMNFNVANTTSNDPDPVATLQTRFEAWRNNLRLRPDAVRSSVSFAASCLPVGGSTTMTIRLRDWLGAATSSAVRVEHAPDSDRRSSIGAVRAIGSGTYEVTLTAGAAGGRDIFRIVTNESQRAVVLMPAPTVLIDSSADFNSDGQVDFSDYLDFAGAFASDAPEADFDASGQIDLFDYLEFAASFACGR
ncbi:MAG: DUF1028 domain-containing protein [Planctomycetota bacterium]|nr:DUF1028 domain-containing protein [Planctomycetota bacterium]